MQNAWQDKYKLWYYTRARWYFWKKICVNYFVAGAKLFRVIVETPEESVKSVQS